MASSDELPFIGLIVEFDHQIPVPMRSVVAEAAMRYWQRNVGSVRRGGRADLAGWRVYVFHQGRVARVRLSYVEEEEQSEADG